MTNDQKPLIHRKSTRLIKYDYSLPGYYFITICSQDRQYLFGKIVNEKMKLNNIGKTIDGYWHKLPEKFNNILLDKHTVMPNHLHGIIVINDDVANNTVGAPLWAPEQTMFINGRVQDPPLQNEILNHKYQILNNMEWPKSKINAVARFISAWWLSRSPVLEIATQ